MALDDLEGIANVTYSLAGSLTWETAADWDAAKSESGVVHEAYGQVADAAVIELGYPSAYSPGGKTPSAQYHGLDSAGPLEDISGNANDGSESGNVNYQSAQATGPFGYNYARATNTSGSNGEDGWNSGIVPNISTSGPGLTVAAWVYPISRSGEGNGRSQVFCCDDGGFDWSLLDENGNWHMFNTNNTQNSGRAADLNQWQHLVGVWGTDDNSTVLFENGTKYTASTGLGSGSTANGLRLGFNPGAGENYDVLLAHAFVWEDTLTDAEAQSLYFTSGSLTTATKSFSSPVKPDLQNLAYSLNGGAVDVDVTGSPAGTSETVTQTLGGATGYALTWSNSHQDFEVTIKPSVSSITNSTPTISRIELGS